MYPKWQSSIEKDFLKFDYKLDMIFKKEWKASSCNFDYLMQHFVKILQICKRKSHQHSCEDVNKYQSFQVKRNNKKFATQKKTPQSNWSTSVCSFKNLKTFSLFFWYCRRWKVFNTCSSKKKQKTHTRTHMIKKEDSLLFAITLMAKQSGWQAMSQLWVDGSVVIPTEEIEQISKPPYLDCGYPFIYLRISWYHHPFVMVVGSLTLVLASSWENGPLSTRVWG